MPTPLSVTRGDDYNPNLAPVTGTLRYALQNQSGDRTVTPTGGVVASGIDLGPLYGPVIISNTSCAVDLNGAQIREFGLSVVTSDVQIEDVVIAPNATIDGRCIILTDLNGPTAITDVSVTGATLTNSGISSSIAIQHADYASSFDNIAFTNLTIDGVTSDIASSHAILVSGPNFGQCNGKFTYTNVDMGTIHPLSERLPLVFGGLHTFTDCEIVQGWSTSSIKAAYVNWIRVNWVTRAQPGGATFWYAGRPVMVSFTDVTKMYFEDCTLDGVPKTGAQLSKLFSITGNDDVPGACIVGAALTTVPNNPVPTISSLSPSTYHAAGITNILATGTGFRPNSTATVNGVAVTATLVDTVEGTTISLAVPASVFTGPGAYSVLISNPLPGGGASSAATLTIQSLAARQSNTSANIAMGVV